MCRLVRRFVVPCFAALFALALAACTEPLTTPEGPAVEADREMAASVTEGPTNPGSSPVFRVELPGSTFPAVMWVDGDNDLATLLSTTEGLRQPLTTSLCPGEEEGEVNAVELQTVQQGTVEALAQADMFVWVYHFPSSFDGPAFVTCDFLTGDALLAGGEARFSNVNNALGGAEDRAEQFTLKVNGRLDLADGAGTTTLNQTNMGVEAPDGDVIVSEIRILLTPDPRD
jgi:hypothetical protein